MYIHIEKVRARLFVESYVVPLLMCLAFSVSISAMIHWRHSFNTGLHVTIGIASVAILISMISSLDNHYFLYKLFTGIERTKFIKVISTIFFGTLSAPFYFVLSPIALYFIQRFPLYLYIVTYYVSTILLFTSGAFVRHKGLFKSVEDGVPKVFAFFHSSFIDYLIFAHVMGYKMKWKIVVGVNLRKYSIFRGFLDKIAIYVERDNPESEAQALREIIKALEDGYNVGISPTAGRNRKGEARDFKPGPFFAACIAKCPVLPIAIHGALDYCPPGPKTDNPKGVLPEKFFERIKYFYFSFKKLIKAYASGECEHLLICPGIITINVLPQIETVGESRKDVMHKTYKAIYGDMGLI